MQAGVGGEDWLLPPGARPEGGTGEEPLSCLLFYLEGFPLRFYYWVVLGPPTTFQIFPTSLSSGSSSLGAEPLARAGGWVALAGPQAQHSCFVLFPLSGFEVSWNKRELWAWSSKISGTVGFSFAALYAGMLSGLQLFGWLTWISKRH